MLIGSGALALMAFIPIWMGSQMSLSSIGPGGMRKADDSDEIVYAEAMTQHDAGMFPVIGTGVLVTLFVLFKFLKLQDYVNMILTAYFVAIGIYAVSSSFAKPFLARLPGCGTQDEDAYDLSLNLWFWDPTAEPVTLSFTNLDVMAVAVSTLLCLLYALGGKHWILNNLIALAFCIEGLRSLSIGSYKIGTILLGGLFFYDIFHVFYSHHVFGDSTMVTVARGLQAPIAVKFPRQIFTSFNTNLSLLGLGDIVLPGVFIALLRRFDAYKSDSLSATPVYFIVTYISYIFGLVATFAVMYVFNAAQPALLYLVPAVLGGSFATATLRGEIGDLLSYSEGAQEEDDLDSKKTQ